MVSSASESKAVAVAYYAMACWIIARIRVNVSPKIIN